VTNGDFEEATSTGWEESIAGLGATISRGTFYDIDMDYEVHLEKTSGSGHVKLKQQFSIPSTNITLSAKLKIYAEATGIAWASAGLAIIYLDQNDALLGRTVIGAKTRLCPWVDSPTFHYIDAEGDQWAEYALDLGEELLNLPGIERERIRKLDVQLAVVAVDC